MKFLNKSTLLFFVVFAVALSSCSDDNSGPLDEGMNDQIFTAKIDGEKFTSLPEETDALVLEIQGLKSISIAGKDAQNHELVFIISGFTGVGTYKLDLEGGLSTVSSAMYIEESGDDVQIWTTLVGQGEAGKIIVTDYSPNKRIKGTFQFDVYNNADDETIKNCTEGVFDVNLL